MNSNITLKLEHTLVEVGKNQAGKYYEAVLKNKDSQEVVVQFDYIVDGTHTGEVYEIAGADYNIGFDARADTGEPSTMNQHIRGLFVNGNGAELVGWRLPAVPWNRVLSFCQ